ncbi:MAG: glutathione S-transferase N-terminal domain-containing protein [Gammaproteobacteria bacterium]|nr:glutathione S-transferase N-terminal domain-containing protein [Gammaproteobacteria bacterium]
MNNSDLEQEMISAFTDEPLEKNFTPKLALYMTPFCPFCIYVKSAIASLDMEVEMRNIYEQEHFEELISARKRATVPVLRISTPNEESWLPESTDIVEYLKELKQAN